MDEILKVNNDNNLVSQSEYSFSPVKFFSKLPEVARPLVDEAEIALSKIEESLYSAPAFINLIKSSLSEVSLQAVLSEDQKQKLATGALKLMTKKDGSLMATLIKPETKKMVANIPLETVKTTPEINQAMTGFASQMQMAQIAEQIQSVSIAIESVRKGQEDDRLAIAYSCQQKLLQAREIKNPELQSMMLMQVISDAEDSRNLLMLSQKSNLQFINEQPESTFGKILKGEKPEKIESRINEIRDGLNAVNMVSLVAALAYNELGEKEAARKSLMYFADFIKKTYLESPGLVDRLDMIDPSPENYWTLTIPSIEQNIVALPVYSEVIQIEGSIDEKE
mgnify:FL=1